MRKRPADILNTLASIGGGRKKKKKRQLARPALFRGKPEGRIWAVSSTGGGGENIDMQAWKIHS